ncbi:MAG: alkaline phosphatase [Halioglobus sp.]
MHYRSIAPILLTSILLTPIAVGSDAQEPASSEAPRQVILIVGDGMDDQQISIARNYLKGANGRLLIDGLPLRSNSQVQTVEDQVDGKPLYVSDSANSATSMATGIVTSRGRIATTAGADEDVPTIMELAKKAGFKTGIVTTSSVTDATPASFASHIKFRLCENPELMEEITFYGVNLGECTVDLKSNGGKGSIAVQLAESSVDVILGGGSKHFAAKTRDGDTSVLQLAQSKGFETVANARELAQADPGKRLLGLFAKSTLPVRMRGEEGRIAEKPGPSFFNQISQYLGSVNIPEPMKCEANPESTKVPSLKQMTDTALAHLTENNTRGFYLMIESASIDKQAHKRDACGSIGEVEQLMEALESSLAYAEKNPNTLVLVTADHGQAAQLVPDESLYSDIPIPIYSPGHIVRIVTPEGVRMAVNYATTNFDMEEHTGVSVPLYGNQESLGRVPAFVQQRELFTITKDYLGL